MHVFCDISRNKEETTSDSKRKETTLYECMNSDVSCHALDSAKHTYTSLNYFKHQYGLNQEVVHIVPQ